MDQGLVFNIQRYSLNDGTGIRTIIFLKGCPLRCEWCSNPESLESYAQIVFKAEACIDCGKCQGLHKEIKEKGGSIVAECGSDEYERASHCPTEALEIIGHYKTIDEILREIEKDREFYDTSKGGVTISGGEPLLQSDFVSPLIDAIKKKHIHVAIETTGFAPWEKAQEVLKKCDLILFDVKHMDAEKHRQSTGISNKVIQENLRKIAAIHDNIIIRIPLIGGINNDEENIHEVTDLALELGIKEIHLLPYHRFGESKYDKLGKSYTFEAYTPDDNELSKLKRFIESKGISVYIGG